MEQEVINGVKTDLLTISRDPVSALKTSDYDSVAKEHSVEVSMEDESSGEVIVKNYTRLSPFYKDTKFNHRQSGLDIINLDDPDSISEDFIYAELSKAQDVKDGSIEYQTARKYITSTNAIPPFRIYTDKRDNVNGIYPITSYIVNNLPTNNENGNITLDVYYNPSDDSFHFESDRDIVLDAPYVGIRHNDSDYQRSFATNARGEYDKVIGSVIVGQEKSLNTLADFIKIFLNLSNEEVKFLDIENQSVKPYNISYDDINTKSNKLVSLYNST